jgi:hypothetical protein
MDLFERLVRLTPMEVSQTEDILVDSFMEAAPIIEKSIHVDKEASKLFQTKERVEAWQRCVKNVGLLIERNWSGREKHELEILSELCMFRVWTLTEEEKKVRNEIKKEELLLGQNKKITLSR